MNNTFLVVAGILNLCASIAHFGIIIGGAKWYRIFGAGERLATMVEEGKIYPHFITIGIALVLLFMGLLALSEANLILEIPYSHIILWGLTCIYLIRGSLGLIAPFINHPTVMQNSKLFWVWSSLICLVLGVVHLVGLTKILLF